MRRVEHQRAQNQRREDELQAENQKLNSEEEEHARVRAEAEQAQDTWEKIKQMVKVL